jgi:hypothetical protein
LPSGRSPLTDNVFLSFSFLAPSIDSSIRFLLRSGVGHDDVSAGWTLVGVVLWKCQRARLAVVDQRKIFAQLKAMTKRAEPQKEIGLLLLWRC